MTRRISRRTVALGLLAASPAAAQSLLQDNEPVRSERFAAAVAYSARRGGVGFLVMRHGVILAEDYPNGGDFRATVPLGDVSQIFAPILAASLVRDRRLTLDEPAALALPEWSADPAKPAITIRQLLQQTSGLAPSAAEQTATADALARPVVADPGTVFRPDAGDIRIFAEIARRRLVEAGAPDDLSLYLQMRTLNDVGAAPIGWSRLADGGIDFATGASCPLRALAMVGEFVRRRGMWQASFRVNPQAIDAATVGSMASQGRRGMVWQRADGAPPAAGEVVTSDLWGDSQAPPDTLFAANPSGLRVMIVPSRAVVVVRAGGAQDWSDATFLKSVLAG